jgi:predicted lipoprotein with Yx(FWY)xxD motif
MLHKMKCVVADHRRLPLPIAALASAAMLVLFGVALARTFTLRVAKDAQVTNTAGMTSTEPILINGRGRAVYDLSGDSKKHPECTKGNGCIQFWLPVTVSSAKALTKAPGIKGRLATWRRNGFVQATLAGHPLYTFVADDQQRVATGEGIKSFGGTWHVIKAGGAATGPTGMTTSPTTSTPATSTPTTSTPTTSTTPATTTTSPTTTTTPCFYPPCS